MELQDRYAGFSLSLLKLSEALGVLKKADRPDVTGPVFAQWAEVFERAEKDFLEMKADAEKSLANTPKDHPSWKMAKKNLEYATAAVFDLGEMRRELEEISAMSFQP